ncbi:HD domain-containing protein [uncultured Eubacterium sp.]|uniref:HD domain-containing protein n=1 Tax=uncultured Eubacterium sp. TaxID=165185 RepID=UPI003262EAB9
MIDYNKSQEMFDNYLKSYDLKDGSIQLKIRHTYEVVKKSEYIARGLGLDKENIELAKVIALLHDIGRFEQIKLFHQFDNAKLDHAQYGVEVLFKNNLIREFVKDNQYDQIIEKSIENHNKYKIDEGMQEIETLHCKIIRDADKIDNFRVKEKDNLKDMFPQIYNEKTINYEKLSQKVYETFLSHKCIKLEDRKTIIDYWVCVIAFIFDLNFDISLQYVKDSNYIDKLIDRIEYKDKEIKEKMEQIRKCGNEYLILGRKII